MTHGKLERLAEVAVRTGELPGDPFVSTSTVDVRADTTCSLCTLALSSHAFALRARNRVVLLHSRCYSAWVDVVVTRQTKPTEQQ